jgi:hypothetical protein
VTAESPIRPPFEFSRVVGGTFEALCRRPFSTLLMATIFCYLPTLAAAYLLPGRPDDLFSIEFVWRTLAALPVSVLSAVFAGWVALVLISSPANASSMTLFGRVLAHGMPLLLAGLTVSAGGLIGMFLFIVPGVLWSLATTVALPACVVERLGPKSAILRSFGLTDKRWAIIFVYTLVIFLPFGALSWLIDPPVIDWTTGQAVEASHLTRYVIRPILDSSWIVISCAFGAAVYRELAGKSGRTD